MAQRGRQSSQRGRLLTWPPGTHCRAGRRPWRAPGRGSRRCSRSGASCSRAAESAFQATGAISSAPENERLPFGGANIPHVCQLTKGACQLICLDRLGECRWGKWIRITICLVFRHFTHYFGCATRQLPAVIGKDKIKQAQ